MGKKKQQQQLIAFEIHEQADMPIEPAPGDRAWMDASDQRFAYRCLPLVMANQCGWIIRAPVEVTAIWNGGAALSDLSVSFPGGSADKRVTSHFGSGVLTFTIPYLFRTPRGINLWVKGPANEFKDGVQALEGLVESDWAESTFTMNWKVTRVNHPVTFSRGEPICMLVPVSRNLATDLTPVRRALKSDADLNRRFQQWSDSRKRFNEALAGGDPEVAQLGWQRDYMLGRDTDGGRFPEHQTKLRIQPFHREA